MIALYVLLGVLLLLLLPITARYRFQGEGRLTVRYAGIPVYVYVSSKEGKKRNIKDGKRTKKDGTKKKKRDEGGAVKRLTAQLKEDGAAGVLSLLQEGLRFADGTARRVRRLLHFGHCRVGVRLGGSEAADIAIRYGKLSGPIYSARSVLLSLLRIRRLELRMQPDFLAEKDTVTADIRVRACPLHVLWVALCTAVSGMGMLSRLSNTQDKDGRNGKKGQ